MGCCCGGCGIVVGDDVVMCVVGMTEAWTRAMGKRCDGVGVAGTGGGHVGGRDRRRAGRDVVAAAVILSSGMT